MEATELDLGVQRIKKMGSYHYLRVPKQLVDSGAIPIDAEYKVRVNVHARTITIETNTSEVDA